MEKTVNHGWDYAVADTKYFTHGIHTYPAMMIPQVARRLIHEESKGAKTGLDPFCGSGSVLLEFKLANINSYGIDINPLARLISKVKTTPINPSELMAAFNRFERVDLFDIKKVEVPKFKNLEYWFGPHVSKTLVKMKNEINKIKNDEIKNFFLVCLSETIRKVSNTRQSEFKLYRIPENMLRYHNPNPFLVFSKIFKKNLDGMTRLYEATKGTKTGWVRVQETNHDITKKTKIPPGEIDLVVTSPPYGDSRTTVAYGQFSRLSLQWFGFSDKLVMSLDNLLLGGKRPDNFTHLSSPTLDKTLQKIAKEDEKRALDVFSFFADFDKAITEIDRLMSDRGVVCLVVGDRTVKKVKVLTDEIMTELFMARGYRHKRTVIRSIPSKRMPRRNSPTNVPGETLPTMNEEYIVVLKKQ